jgi:uncharacterized protein (TIGR02300 family)
MDVFERGTKRLCQSCGGKYYDLNHVPVLCPLCQTEFDPAAGVKLRSDTSYKPQGGRARSVFGRPRAAVEEASEEVVAAVEDEDEKIEADETDEDGEEPVEDAGELGDDEDDLAEIVENGETEER